MPIPTDDDATFSDIAWNGITYADILKQNEDSIRAYNWQQDGSNKCVATEDLDGDSIPELMFFAEDNNGANLHVFTFADDNAVEFVYDNTGSMNNQGNMPQGILFRDIPAAAGTKYVIYTGKENGSLYIGSSMVDMNEYYQSDRYRVSDDHSITLEREAANIYMPKTDNYPESDEYYINGSSVSNKDGKAEFKADTDEFGTLLMYSGKENDMNAFKKTENVTPAAMTIDEALDILQKKRERDE